jgi:hypothetical protein
VGSNSANIHINTPKEQQPEQPQRPHISASTPQQQRPQILSQYSNSTSSNNGPHAHLKSNNTMAACLFIMDDTIRLMEWLAYHMTVLPLGHLVVAVDPKSKKQQKVLDILDQYRPFFRIDSYTNDTWLTLEDDDGWGRKVRGPKGNYRHWFTDKEGDTFKAQAHKRRQNFFFSFCLQSLYNAGTRSWTILIDSDEFLVYNYRHEEAENASIYDAETKIITKDHLDQARERILPIRETLPKFNEEVTMADFLQDYVGKLNHTEEESLEGLAPTVKKLRKQQAMKDHALETSGVKLDRRPRCLRFPHLRFSSYESDPAILNASMPTEVDPTTLMTLRQRKVGPMEGLFSKAMLDLSQAKSAEWFNFKGVVNVHTPSRRMCGRTTKVKFSGSGTDYMSSLFRINHYRSGTIETYLERSGDYRGSSIWRFYAERNIPPVSENDDIRPWIHWFIKRVGGMTEAKRLLLDPMAKAYHAYQQNHEAYEGAKEVLDRLQGENDPLEHGAVGWQAVKYNYTKLTDSKHMAACVMIRHDQIRLTEWLAYHYTVMPLGAVVVGIDAKSMQEPQIRETLNRWSPYMNVTIWANDEWLEIVDETEGFREKVEKNGKKVPWFLNKTSAEFLNQNQIRHESIFLSQCLSLHHRNGQDWTMVVDPEEFVVFNYKGKQENPVKFDSREEGVRTKDDIIQTRTESSPIRDRLPLLQDRVTVRDFLFNEKEHIQKCLRMPGLEMGPKDFGIGQHDAVSENLLTIRQRQFGCKKGTWTKSLLDVSKSNAFGWQQVDSAHNANLPLCGKNGHMDATDYISALIRFQRYKVGSMETYFDHHDGETTDETLMRLYKSETDDFEPYGDDHDSMMPWVAWFVDKVGEKAAKELLADPLAKAYTDMETRLPVLKEAKEEAQSAVESAAEADR